MRSIQGQSSLEAYLCPVVNHASLVTVYLDDKQIRILSGSETRSLCWVQDVRSQYSNFSRSRCCALQ